MLNYHKLRKRNQYYSKVIKTCKNTNFMKKVNLYLILSIILLNFLILKGELAYGQQTVKLLSHTTIEVDDSAKLIGQVQNMLDKKIENVKAIVTFYRQDSTIIGSETSDTDPSTILPKMKANFKMNLDQSIIDKVSLYDITITWQYPLEDDAQVYQFVNPLEEKEKETDD